MVDNITSGNTTLFSGKSQTLKQSNDNDGPRVPGCLEWTHKKCGVAKPHNGTSTPI